MIIKTGLVLIFGFLLVGCSSPPTESIPLPSETIPIEDHISTAIVATEQALETQFSPSQPYNTIQLAILLEPGDDLEGSWRPSSVVDLTQPIPEFPCGDGYYGACWPEWPGVADYGVNLKLLLGGEEMGSTVFIYYDDLQDIETIYQAYHSRWITIKEDEEQSYNDIWLHYFNRYDNTNLGEISLNNIGYSLYEPDDRELLTIRVVFVRCHGLVSIELRFPPDTNFKDDEKNTRLQEQETLYQLVYEYAQAVDQRISAYVCFE